MQNRTAISVDKLAKIIDIHKNTLTSWLCHYSLCKYVYEDITSNTKHVLMFSLSRRSINALRKYLSKKNLKYLKVFDEYYN